MSDSFQIEIPSFDEDEDSANVTTPVPYNHNRAFFDSESTPLNQYPDETSSGGPYRSHARGGSSTSESSVYSSGPRSPEKSRPVGHASTSSLATASSSVPKKSSFASLRAAMKSMRAFSDFSERDRVPPVPSLEQNYPALKNPFSKQQVPQRAQSPANKAKKRPNGGSARAQASYSSTMHSRDKSSTPSENWRTHAQSASSAHGSDFSDSAGLSPQSIPPVPRVPREYGSRHQPASSSVFTDIVSEPRTPSEFALHVVFTRFVAHVEAKIDVLLNQPLDQDPSLTSFLGAGADPILDSLLDSLGHIAARHAKSVVESVMRWRRSQAEAVPPAIVKRSLLSMNKSGKVWTMQEATSVLNTRKGLSSIYILCRALIILIRSMGKDGLPETMAMNLEENIFDQFKTCDPRLLAHSANRRANAALYTEVLGAMANSRFMSVTDRFLSVLGSLPNEQVQSEMEQRYEHIVLGMSHIRVKVWPPEAFEEGAEFMEALSKSFVSAHGFGLKTAFAETLTQMLHPMGKTAQAEVNHPMWAKAMLAIYPKAFAMVLKPRYHLVTYRLAVSSLCVSPTDFFLKYWTTLFELSAAKLRDRSSRLFSLNGMVRLLWTYLFRCHQPGSTVTKTLDGYLRALFPSTRQGPYSSEEPLDIFVYAMHIVFSAHFDYGRDLVLESMNESVLSQVSISSQGQSFPTFLAPEKMIIALRSTVLTLRALGNEKSPSWPNSSDFSVWEGDDEYSPLGETLSEAVITRAGVREFIDRLSRLIGKIVSVCERLVGDMFVSDERFALARQAPTYEDREFLVMKQNGSRVIAFRKDLLPYIDLLRACYDSWPACWNRSIRLPTVLDILVTGVAHVDPDLNTSAADCLRRFAALKEEGMEVLLQVTSLLFSPDAILRAEVSIQPMCEHLEMVTLWVDLIETWTARQTTWEGDTSEEQPANSVTDAALQLIESVESGSLLLLCSTTLQIRLLGARALRAIASLPGDFLAERGPPGKRFKIIDVINGSVGRTEYEERADRSFGVEDGDRLNKWPHLHDPGSILKLIEDPSTDRFLWRFVFPPFLVLCMESRPRTVSVFRGLLSAAISRVHSTISTIAGITGKVSVQGRSPGPLHSMTDPTQFAAQWISWLMALSATAVPTESAAGVKEHSRHGSDPSPQWERITTPRGLIRLALPYLAADATVVRDGIVHALGCIHPSSLRVVLEDMQSLTRHFNDDPGATIPHKLPARRSRGKDRLYTSVLHVHQLTADFLQHALPDRLAIAELMLSVFYESMHFFTDAHSRSDTALLAMKIHFCGFAEQLFTGLSLISERVGLKPNVQLTTFRICQDWCFYPNSGSGNHDPRKRTLCDAAVRAMSSLCMDVSLFQVSSDSATQGFAHAPLTYLHVLQWVDSMLTMESTTAIISGKKALRLLCIHSLVNSDMSGAVSGFCSPSAKNPAVSAVFFDIISDILLQGHVTVPLCRILFLGLSNLIHVDWHTRDRAFDLLEFVVSHRQPGAIIGLRAFFLSPSEGINIQGQRQVASLFAGIFSDESMEFLSECSARLSQGYDGSPYLLRILVPWLAHVELALDEYLRPPSGTLRAFANLLSITAVHLQQYPDDVCTLWQELVSGQFPGNGRAVIRVSILHTLRCGREDFLRIVQTVVASFSDTAVGLDSFNYLSDTITASSMSLSDEDTLLAGDFEEPWDIDSLFPSMEDRFWLSYGQISCLLLSDVVLPSADNCDSKMHVVLHALILLIDNESNLVHSIVQNILGRVLRLWYQGEDGITASKNAVGAILTKVSVPVDNKPQGSAATQLLTEDVCRDILQLLEPSHPTLRQQWSELAIQWAAATPSRHTATRSLQVFRIVTPSIESHTMALLLGRLSNTISDPSERVQTVAAEILRGIEAVARSLSRQELLGYPQIFWTGVACLQSSVKGEFLYGVEILETLFNMFDDNELAIIEHWKQSQPSDWGGPNACLESFLMTGLRSTYTSEPTFRLLRRLAQFPSSPLIDASGDRLQCLFAVALPGFLNSMDAKGTSDDMLKRFALDFVDLAEQADWQSLAHIMTSFAKNRFRTREDFLRQAVSCLRERLNAQQGLETITLLISLVLNNQCWLRVNTMQILKLLFSSSELRKQMQCLGSEHLTPLLRLLNTDLAPQALEVLDEPVSVQGGLSARQVVRMSLMPGLGPSQRAPQSVGAVFGIPDDTGWCVPKPEESSALCRTNLTAIYSTFNEASRKLSTSIASVIFAGDGPDLVAQATPQRASSEDGAMEASDSLGDLVSSLHDLSNYFEDDESGNGLSQSASSSSMKDAERRVAAILSRSLTKSSIRTPSATNASGFPSAAEPPTPFMDLFSMAGPASASSDTEGISRYYLTDDSETEGYFSNPDQSQETTDSSWEHDHLSDSDDGASATFGLEDEAQPHDNRAEKREGASHFVSNFSPKRIPFISEAVH